MEHRTLLCASHFVKKLTSSHQHVSFVVNGYYKIESPRLSAIILFTAYYFTLN